MSKPTTFYQASLFAEWVHRNLIAAGIPSTEASVEITPIREAGDVDLASVDWYNPVTVEVHSIGWHVPVTDPNRWHTRTAADREAFANTWVDAHPGTHVLRNHGDIYLLGADSLGHTYRLRVGEGLCERVQVGTRTVKKVDPAYLVDAPLIEVEEPVYEVRCADPLVEVA